LRADRTEQRRKAREQEANSMNELLRNPASEPAWDDLLPVLDEAMHKLGEKDRVAVLLRENPCSDCVSFSLSPIGRCSSQCFALARPEAHRKPDGKWARLYAYGDGRIVEATSEDGNLDAWEKQHTSPRS